MAFLRAISRPAASLVDAGLESGLSLGRETSPAMARREAARSVPQRQRPRVRGRFLIVNGARFWVKGVTYGTFRPNARGEPYPDAPRVQEDFRQMRAAGVNTVRLYTPPPDWLADLAAEAGLWIMADVCWGPRRCDDLDNPERLAYVRQWTREHSRRLADHPAMLLFSIGNEIPPLMVRWYGKARIEGFLRELHDIVKTEAPYALTTYVNHPPTEYLTLPFLDVESHNLYLEREPELRAYLARLLALAHEKPVLLAETGLDARQHGEAAQARFLDWQIRAAFGKGLCGVTVYGWTDEWGIFGSDIEGWAFGLTDAQRQPKPALATVARLFRGDLYRTRPTPWPMVSVVVCCYNAGATLDECLRSLVTLDYPNYEVIAVDDGSTDGTHWIAQGHGVRCLRVPNGGLSRARNLGIENARGEIVAFIDSDAYADPDWLYYVVCALEEHDAAAVGGPNLSPPQDGFLAQCVDESPGNPTCVLVDNERAEHIPGCNMAFRKSAFAVAGQFDAQHRAAGDDVDLCWRVLLTEGKIVYHPAALVWHHRRPTIGGYLKQQKGYGFAEAHLQQRYPGRFNFFGYPVWKGGVYDSVHSHLRQQGLPFVFHPRIYRGAFCGAQFQTLYQPFVTWWFQIFSTAEWLTLTASLLLSGLLSLVAGPAGLGGTLLGLSGAMSALSVGTALLAGWRGVRQKRWTGVRWARGLAVISVLHLLQPLARTVGRLQGAWRLRKEPPAFPDTDLLYGNLDQRERWLRRLLDHMESCGWQVRACSEWDDGDLEILGPGPHRLKLTSVYEEVLERAQHYVRYRVTVKTKLYTPVVVAALMAALIGLTQALYLAPLALPIVMVLRRYVQARKNMLQAVSQMAMDAGWPIGMTRAKANY